MLGIDIWVIVALAVVALAVVGTIVARKSSTPALGPAPEEFSDIHPGKQHAGGCKFNADEVRATAHQIVPPIDVSNVPDPDPRVQAALDGITVEKVTNIIADLSGERETRIGDRAVTIRSRNSHTGDSGIGLALEYVEQFYRKHGLSVRRIPYQVRGRTYFNLEVTIVGRKTPDKVLVVGSHLDSTAGWTWNPEKVAPGADDDASGTSACMLLAVALNELGPDCTVRVLHFTGEEQGLWGSYRYSDKVKAENTDVVAMIQMDMIGYCPNPEHRLDVHDARDRNGSHALTVEIFRQIKRYGLDLTPVDTHNGAVENRSDHAGFLDHGYRAIMLSEEFTDTGFNPNYHQTTDRLEKLNLKFLVEVVRAATATAAELAGLSK